MRRPRSARALASGFILLESMLAIVIFSIGIIGMIGLQAVSAKQTTDARYRTEAALLANQLIGRMWVSDRSAAALQTAFNTGNSSYTAWVSNVAAKLPGVGSTAPSPVVQVDSSGQVTIAIYWLSPNEAQGTQAHNLITVTQIR